MSIEEANKYAANVLGVRADYTGVDVRVASLRDKLSDEEVTNNLSEYAWNNNNSNRYGEFVAEAWAEYRGSPNPRSTAKDVGETVERMYEEWKKKRP